MIDVRKATRQDLKRHNRSTLLRAVVYGLADNRAALAQITGLAKPTVSDLISELITEGFLIERGTGEAAENGGKRPRLLEFVPAARQVIGVSIDAHQITGVLADLSGRIVAEHIARLDGTRVIDILIDAINGLIAQLDAPLLCIGVGVPGVVDSERGIVEHCAPLGWRHLPLAEQLSAVLHCPVTVANNTELAALAQFAFRSGEIDRSHNLITILVNSTAEIGVALRGAYYHHGGDIGGLRLTPTSAPLHETLSWAAIQHHAADLRASYPATMLPERDLTIVHLRYAAINDDPLAWCLIDELAEALATVTAWAIMLLHPHHVSLAGEIAELGAPLLDRLRAKTTALLAPETVDAVTFSLADDARLSAVGALAHAIHQKLDIL
ncbi:MAG: ROK family protein [Chloroflexota bacterium]|nr:ROK family protein [Chloroflexota bacterium]